MFLSRHGNLCARGSSRMIVVAVVVASFTAATASTVAADLRTPLMVTNQNPFVRIFGLPVAEPGRIAQAGRHRLLIAIDWASNFTHDELDSEQVYIDGESAQATLRWRYGWERWELGIDLPYVYQSGGSLDAFIDDWHSTFNLPSGGRLDAERGRLRYEYQDGEKTPVLVAGNAAGSGDVRVTGAYQLLQDGHWDLSLRAGLKLPTGDSDSLQSSGGYDINVGFALSDAYSLQDYNTSIFAGAGVLLTEQGDVLSEQRRETAVYGNLGLSTDAFEHWQFKLQLDGHSELYDSQLTELGGSIQLSIGGAVAISRRWVLDFAVVEDIVVDSASDVNFHLNLQRTY